MTRIDLRQYVKPDPVVVEIKRIGALIEKDDLATAEADARRLLRTYPKRPDVHNTMGITYIKQDKNEQAVPHLEFAVRAEPNNPHYLNNLGRLYLDLGLVELALPFLNKALALDPSLTSSLLAIGKYYNEVGKADLALPYFERLHKLAPHDDQVKWELAESLDVLNRKEEAGALNRDLHESKTHHIPAIIYFSRNAPPEGNAALITEIEHLLPSDTLNDLQRGALHTALGFIHEKEKNYPLAFSHFETGNRFRASGFDIGLYRAWVDGVIELCTPDFFRARANWGDPSDLPVLVVGMPRSGTTMTEQMIASHGRAGGAGELMRIRLFAQKLNFHPSRKLSSFVTALEAQGEKGLRGLGGNYVDLLKFHAPKAERIVDKMPHNFESLGIAALMCPNARAIHCTRNPVDTCLSCFQNPLNDSHAYSKDLTHLGLYYREYKRLTDHWKKVLPLKIYDSNYEEFTADFEGEARKIIDFLGLPWDEACLKFHESGRTVRTFSRQQVRSAVNRGSVERWRRYEKELKPLLDALGDLAPV